MPDLIICKCGRIIGPKPHCVKCGSTNIYHTKSHDRSMMMEGEMFNDRAFQCRACGSAFRESMDCAAPLTKDAARIQNDYPMGNESRRSVSEAKRIKEKLKNYTIERIVLGKRLLTQDEEDDFQRRYGESLSQAVGMPIVEGPEVHQTSIEVLRDLGLPDPDNLLGSSDDKDPNANGT